MRFLTAPAGPIDETAAAPGNGVARFVIGWLVIGCLAILVETAP